MSDELLDLVLEELPDAFRRSPGTAVDKVANLVAFFQTNADELQKSYAAIPDSLNRSLPERIRLVLDNLKRESEIAVKLRQRCEELKPGSSSDI